MDSPLQKDPKDKIHILVYGLVAYRSVQLSNLIKQSMNNCLLYWMNINNQRGNQKNYSLLLENLDDGNRS